MEEKEKFYDTVLATGARWMMARYRSLPHIDALGVKKISLNNISYGFLLIAQIYQIYEGTFCFGGNIFTYLYLKYIKKLKFLQRPSKRNIDYIDANVFCTELGEYFKSDKTLIGEIYKHYYMEK